MFKLFIRRPILSAVISVIIVCLGGLALVSLPITQFPDIVPPSVTVTTRYTGASADVMAKTVATPLERAINGVPGMTYMTTVCTNDGMSLLFQGRNRPGCSRSKRTEPCDHRIG